MTVVKIICRNWNGFLGWDSANRLMCDGMLEQRLMNYEDDALSIIAPLRIYHRGYAHGGFPCVVFPCTHYTFVVVRYVLLGGGDAAGSQPALIFPPVLSFELHELTFAQV